jgi:hypothetical protein
MREKKACVMPEERFYGIYGTIELYNRGKGNVITSKYGGLYGRAAYKKNGFESKYHIVI